MNNSIDGVYTVEKHEARVRLNKSNEKKDIVFLDYFNFVDCLFKAFPYEVVEKIQTYICENKKMILDFNNKKAILIKDKVPNFNKIYIKEFDSKTIEQYYESVDGNTLETNYVKTILGEEQDVESIFRQSPDTKY